MPKEESLCDSDAARKIGKLTLPDGFKVGIINLDNILKEVADLKLTDTRTIKTELLKRVETCNYVASGAKDEYSVALFQEYQRKWGQSGDVKDGDKVETHKHTAG